MSKVTFGKGRKMKTQKNSHAPISVICAVCVMIFVAGLCSTAVAADKDVWGDKQGQSGMTEEKIERLLDRIAEENPERAEQLRQLKAENPQEFREHLHQLAGKRFGQQGEGRGDGPGDHTRDHDRSTNRRPSRDRDGMGMRDGKGEHGGHGGEGFRERMMKKHDEYTEWFKKEFPAEAEKLESLRQKHPEQYMKQMQSCQKKYAPIMKAQQHNPQLAEVLKEDIQLQSQRDTLLKEYRSADKKEREAIKKELENVVNSRFDIVVKKKQLRYEEMLKKLQKLEEKVNAQQAEVENLKDKKGDAVEQRIEELVGKTEKIDWN
jgi:hypothetical protein